MLRGGTNASRKQSMKKSFARYVNDYGGGSGGALWMQLDDKSSRKCSEREIDDTGVESLTRTSNNLFSGCVEPETPPSDTHHTNFDGSQTAILFLTS